MYSLVLMTAMAGTPDTAQFHGYFRDRWLGNGCSGQCNGCSGAANYTSCSGCNGCWGGLFSGERVRSWFNNCNGCCGAVSYSCGGCNGVSYSCGGGVIYDMGSPYATPVPTSYYPGGCIGMTPMLQPSTDGTPMIPPTNLPGASPFAQPTPADTSAYTPKNQLPQPANAAASPNRATVIVKLPADARLFAESRALSLTGAERSFVTPELPPGREYNYTFRVEYDRNGRTLGETKSITVSPGRVSTVEFTDVLQKSDAAPPMPKVMPETKPAVTTSLAKNEQPARILVKVPAGATLFVNDAKQAANEFRTPPLPAGKEYSYTMKIETLKNGMPESATQKVVIRAGDSTTVDFTTSVAGR